MPLEALGWLGKGSRIEVQFGNTWHLGVVTGTDITDEGEAIVVGYGDRNRGRRSARANKANKYSSIGDHQDLHTRGCRVREFRRRAEEQPECPYDEQEESCGCTHCTSTKWPARYAEAGLTTNYVTVLEVFATRDKDFGEYHFFVIFVLSFVVATVVFLPLMMRQVPKQRCIQSHLPHLLSTTFLQPPTGSPIPYEALRAVTTLTVQCGVAAGSMMSAAMLLILVAGTREG